MQFKNLQTNEIIDAPTEKHSELLLNPNFAPVTVPERLVVRTEDGKEFEGNNLSAARDFVNANPGSSILSQAQTTVESWKESPVLGRVAAVGAGALRGASFGLSDVVARVAGAEEGVKALEEAYPVTSMVGEIGGAIASPIGNKAMTLAKGAREAVAGSKALQAAKPIVQEALPAAVEAGVRGASFGVGQSVSDLALDDVPLTAEHVASTVARDMLLGAIADVGIGAIAGGASQLYQKAGTPVADMLGSAYAKFKSVTSGMSKEETAALKNTFTKERRNVIDAIDNVKNFETSAKETVDFLNKASDEVSAAINKLRVSFQQKATEPGLRKLDTLNSLRELDDSLLNGIEKMKARPSFYNKTTMKQLKQLSDDIKIKMRDPYLTIGGIHSIVETARQNLDDIATFGLDIAPGVKKNTNTVLKGIRRKFKENLESESAYPGLGSQYKEINEPYSKIIQAKKELEKAMFKKVPNETGGTNYEIDQGKIQRWLDDPSSAFNIAKTESIDKAVNALKTLGEHPTLTETGLDSFADNIGNRIESIKTSTSSISALKQLEAQTNKTLSGAIIGGGLGFAMGGLPAVGGAILGVARDNPKTVLRWIGKLDPIAKPTKAAKVPKQIKLSASSDTIMPSTIEDTAQYMFIPSEKKFGKVVSVRDVGEVEGKTGGNVYTIDLEGKQLNLSQHEVSQLMEGTDLLDYITSDVINKTAKVKSLITDNSGTPSQRKIRKVLKDPTEFQAAMQEVDALRALPQTPETTKLISEIDKIQSGFAQLNKAQSFMKTGTSLDEVTRLRPEEQLASLKNDGEVSLLQKVRKYSQGKSGRIAIDSMALQLDKALSDSSKLKDIQEKLNTEDMDTLTKHQSNIGTISNNLASASTTQAVTIKNWLAKQLPKQRTSYIPGKQLNPLTQDERRNFAIKMAAALDPIGTIDRATASGKDLHPVALKTIQELYPRVYISLVSEGAIYNQSKTQGVDVGGIKTLQSLHSGAAPEQGQAGNVKAKITPPSQTPIGRVTAR